MLAAEAAGQPYAQIVAAGLWANVVLGAAIGELQGILVEAALRLGAELVQAAQVEAEVAQMVGRDQHVYLNDTAADVALDYDPSTELAAQLVGAWRGQAVVVAAQAAVAIVFGLFLQKGIYSWRWSRAEVHLPKSRHSTRRCRHNSEALRSRSASERIDPLDSASCHVPRPASPGNWATPSTQ